jgi:hypothetical protein
MGYPSRAILRILASHYFQVGFQLAFVASLFGPRLAVVAGGIGAMIVLLIVARHKPGPKWDG